MIIVCSLADQKSVCLSVNASHLISVVDPGYEPETPHTVKNHLKLGFDDIIDISVYNSIFRNNKSNVKQVLPSLEHTNSIIDFVNSWKKNKPIVIHCWCGVSRSMAVATYLICKEDTLNIVNNIRYIRSVAPHANPNKLMIKFFENSLQVENQITNAYIEYPHTITYDCATNFAPVTIFDINDMKDCK